LFNKLKEEGGQLAVVFLPTKIQTYINKYKQRDREEEEAKA